MAKKGSQDGDLVHQAARFNAEDVEAAHAIAADYAHGNLSLVMRVALELGLKQLKADPTKLLGSS